MYGTVNLWDEDRNWLLSWQVMGHDVERNWLEFTAGPPCAPQRHRMVDPQVTGVATHGRCEFRTVGTVEWDAGWQRLLEKSLQAVRNLAKEHLT